MRTVASRVVVGVAVLTLWPMVVSAQTSSIAGVVKDASGAVLPGVTVARVFSISAGLDTSTVTPGNTAPELSLTTPVTDAWAYAAIGANTTAASANTANLRTPRMPDSLLLCNDLPEKQGFTACFVNPCLRAVK